MLDERVRNGNVAEFTALTEHHLAKPSTGHRGDGMCWLVTETTQSRVPIAMIARTTLDVDGARHLEVREPDASVWSGQFRSSPVFR